MTNDTPPPELDQTIAPADTYEPSFTDGKLKWVSASSLSTVNLCARRFWFDQIARRPRVDRGFFKQGRGVDKQIEHYSLTGEDTLDRVARKVKHFLPLAKHTPDIYVKYKFEKHPALFPSGLGLRGEMDILNCSGIYIDSEGIEVTNHTFGVEIIDIKTPKKPEYIKTTEQLKIDLQLNVYAIVAPSVDCYGLSHISAPKEKGEGQKTTAIVSRGDVWQYFTDIISPLAHRAHGVSLTTEAKQVPENLEACTAYNVICDFHHECPINQADKLYNINLINQRHKCQPQKDNPMPPAINLGSPRTPAPTRPALNTLAPRAVSPFGSKPAEPQIHPKIDAADISLDGKDGKSIVECPDCGGPMFKLNIEYKLINGVDNFLHMNCPKLSPSADNPPIPEEKLAEPHPTPQEPRQPAKQIPTLPRPTWQTPAADVDTGEERQQEATQTILINFGGSVVLIGQWPESEALDVWADGVINRLATRYNLPDIRSAVDNAGKQSALAFGNWKWVLSEAIRAEPMPATELDLLTYDTLGCDLREAVAQGLISKGRDGTAIVGYVPGR